MSEPLNRVNTGFYVDDTGKDGHATGSKYLDKERITLVGILFSSWEREEAENQMLSAIEWLKKEYNVDEFHFTDIYSGRDKFKNIEFEERMAIFYSFAKIYNEYQWPIIVQTINTASLIENGAIFRGKILDYNLEKKDDMALLFLQLNLKNWIKEKKDMYTIPIDIIIDEGRQKAGSYRDSILSSTLVNENRISYKKSSHEPLLQIADFIAFCHNRIQWILTKENRTEIDKVFMDIFREVSFNILNLPKVVFNEINNFTKDDYDYLQFQDKTEKNLMTRSEVEGLIMKIEHSKKE